MALQKIAKRSFTVYSCDMGAEEQKIVNYESAMRLSLLDRLVLKIISIFPMVHERVMEELKPVVIDIRSEKINWIIRGDGRKIVIHNLPFRLSSLTPAQRENFNRAAKSNRVVIVANRFISHEIRAIIHECTFINN